jgi:AraC family transcriptional regulator
VPSALAYGVHLGEGSLTRELPGFSLSVLRPTLHEEDVPLHTHASASLVLVLEGAYRTSADGPSRLLSGETLIYNPPGTTHRDSFVRPQGRFLAVSISHPTARSASDYAPLPHVAVQASREPALASARRLLAHLQTGGPGVSLALEDACWEVLAAIGEATAPTLRTRSIVPPWLREARALLQEPDGDLSIPSLAAEVGVHPVHLARRFRRHVGCSPAEYRLRCRLQRAMEQIRSGETSLAQVALDQGFFDQSHFTHAFKQHFGHAPGAYRSQGKSARER